MSTIHDAPSHDAPSGPAETELRKRLFVIDDDVAFCALVAEFLERDGFEVSLAHDGVSGLERALQSNWHAIVLDVMLPGLTGFDVLRRLRERSRIPVIMLTARGEPVDRIVGLEMGADDYVPKPVDPRELAARIRAVLRRSESRAGASDAPLRVDAITINPGSREAWHENRVLELTTVEFDLLFALARAAGRVVSRESLSRSVLDRPYSPLDRSLDVHVSNLRRKFGVGRDGGTLLKTVRNAGYMLTRSSNAPEA